MTTLQDIYARVAGWNEKRYDQEYNHDLAMAMLREEYQEYLEAEEPVKRLDALCDEIYFAIGILWKCKVDANTANYNNDQAYVDVVELMSANVSMPVYYIPTIIDSCDHVDDFPVAYAMQMIIQLALTQMSAEFGFTQDDCLEALSIVCDSNDSKSIDKVASNVKANIVKGEFFKAPEPRLTKLLEKARARHH